MFVDPLQMYLYTFTIAIILSDRRDSHMYVCARASVPFLLSQERDRLVFVKYLDHLRTQPLRPSRAQLL
jgi:hypothetical protein